MTRSIKTALVPLDLRIPHFERSVPPGGVIQFAPSSRDTSAWYREFVTRVEQAIGKTHFPVFRFGDGECVFSVGFRLGRPPPGRSALLHYTKSVLSAYVKHRLHRNFRSGSAGYGYELYNHSEWVAARRRFVQYLRNISSTGVIAFNFVIQFGVPFCDRYMDPVCDWLAKEGIAIDEHNFLPCYFVYAMMLGPDRGRILAGKNVLVVTSLGGDKEAQLKEGLEREGVRSVQFRRISRSKAMFDSVGLDTVAGPIHVALIGAGVGAANIIEQLKPLNTLCIDAGYILDCYAEPDRKGSRVFTLPDEEIGTYPIRYGG